MTSDQFAHFSREDDISIGHIARHYQIPAVVLKTAIYMESRGRWVEPAAIEVGARGTILQYTGMFLTEAIDLGFPDGRIRTDKEEQVRALAAKIAFIKLSREWAPVFDQVYAGIPERALHTTRAMQAMKRLVAE